MVGDGVLFLCITTPNPPPSKTVWYLEYFMFIFKLPCRCASLSSKSTLSVPKCISETTKISLKHFDHFLK